MATLITTLLALAFTIACSAFVWKLTKDAKLQAEADREKVKQIYADAANTFK